ncbi:hypothetical protein GOODEAATRI_024006 [Goodea atripinnis]|uniref:Uncharacterized protein n=1 Tax=Goodea atripinnis TaxID=208336 RepID=A0ABV0NDG1_9TELE
MISLFNFHQNSAAAEDAWYTYRVQKLLPAVRLAGQVVIRGGRYGLSSGFYQDILWSYCDDEKSDDKNILLATCDCEHTPQTQNYACRNRLLLYTAHSNCI